MLEQPDLFADHTFPMASDPKGRAAAPICPTCRTLPRKWGPKLRDWARFCGGSACISETRKCKRQDCGATYSRHEGGTRYCPNCLALGPAAAYNPTSIKYTCLRCGRLTRRNRNGRVSNYGCKHCLSSQVLATFKRYNMNDQWAQAFCQTTTCQVQGCDQTFVSLATQNDKQVDLRTSGHRNVDHNHQCCGGATSCGQCIRGIICGRCNTIAGTLEDDRTPKVAAYLKTTWQLNAPSAAQPGRNYAADA